MSKTMEDFKEILLHFVSSELTSHASGLIGFSVMLFAYLNVISQFYPDRVPFTLCFCLSTSTLQYFVVFGILWAINTLIIYTLMRLAFYGRLAFEIIDYEKSANSSKQLWKKITERVKQRKFLAIIPLKWFSKGISALSEGFWFSLFVSFVVSFILMWAFLFY